MAETIESFVAKLQTEGVEAGRQAAEKLHEQARQEAEEILRRAGTEAEKILSDARAEAERLLARGQTELRLAARDAALRFRESLGRALSAVLKSKVGKKLQDAEFLGTVLHELITSYAKSDLARKGSIRINVPPEMRDKLVQWALHELAQKPAKQADVPLDLKGTLAQAGFEYTVTSGTVEVTQESVVEVLTDLIGPSLGKVLEEAMAETKQ